MVKDMGRVTCDHPLTTAAHLSTRVEVHMSRGLVDKAELVNHQGLIVKRCHKLSSGARGRAPSLRFTELADVKRARWPSR